MEKDLFNPSLPALNGGKAATMSSIEIAELVEKRHDNVKRTIETLADQGVIVRPQIEDEQHTDTMGRKRTTSVYHLEKRDTYVVVAQLSPEFTGRLVDRWQELEQATAAPAIDLNDPAQLRGMLLSYSEKLEQSDKALEAAKPKVEAFDALLSADGLYGLQNAARALGAHPNKFTQWLKQNFLFYQGSALVARVLFIQRGYFEVKATIVDDKARHRTYVTPKGLTWLREKVPAEILIGGKT